MAHIYCGDGVYAHYEPGDEHVILTTENGIEVTNTIYLEPAVADAIVEFIKQCHEKQGF